MKIILQFDTEKDEEVNLHKIYIKAEDMSLALWDIRQMFRNRLKYGIEEGYSEIEKLSENFFEILNNYDLNTIID
jgi:hypothetical protein